jgi:predicted phosphohydrolase
MLILFLIVIFFCATLCLRCVFCVRVILFKLIIFVLIENNMIKIQYCSDLHLEFTENKYFLKKMPIKPVGDILVLAGDIVPFIAMHNHTDFFNFLGDNFKQTYWIPGNHEYYQSDISFRSGKVMEKIKNNVFLINNQVIELNDTVLIFSTLWSKIHPQNTFIVQQNVSDFHVIKHHKKSFLPTHFNAFHEEALTFLKQTIQQFPQHKKVVVTHHVPTLMNYPEKYKGDVINEAFATELIDFITDSAIDFWVYGHTHYNVSAYKINKTWMLTNQLGYVALKEQVNYKTDAIFEI